MYLLPRSRFASAVVGAAGLAVGSMIFRPMLVGLVKVGYDVKDYTMDAWETAKREAAAVKAEAAQGSTKTNVEVELKQLRDEVSMLRAQASKRAS